MDEMTITDVSMTLTVRHPSGTTEEVTVDFGRDTIARYGASMPALGETVLVTDAISQVLFEHGYYDYPDEDTSEGKGKDTQGDPEVVDLLLALQESIDRAKARRKERES
jgi:hypothetical protein